MPLLHPFDMPIFDTFGEAIESIHQLFKVRFLCSLSVSTSSLVCQVWRMEIVETWLKLSQIFTTLWLFILYWFYILFCQKNRELVYAILMNMSMFCTCIPLFLHFSALFDIIAFTRVFYSFSFTYIHCLTLPCDTHHTYGYAAHSWSHYGTCTSLLSTFSQAP